MFSLKSLILAFVAALVLCGNNYGQAVPNPRVPDQLAFGPLDNAWNTNGWPLNYAMLDSNNNVQVFTTVGVLATPVAGINHDVDSKGKGHSHWHFRDDFSVTVPPGSPPGTLTTQAQADAYWDQRFQEGRQGDMHRYMSATTIENCFAWALSTSINRATYVYWIDDQSGTPRPSGEVIAAFNADAENVPKENVAGKDVLLYNNGTIYTHATNVWTIDCGPPRSPITLAWKFNVSGMYNYTANSFNTPMLVFPAGTRFAIGRPLPNTGQWKVDGAGSVNQLSPPGRVWRAQPQQN
ncbi:MAG TPA: hypothetical protein VH643_25600 [Gemmataceae bacterium]|jgi:hypothetical protein